MKRIKIFLASSIIELKEERIRLGDFFNTLNEQYLDRGIHFSLIKCEMLGDSLVGGGQQLAVYDPEIRSSDLCLFIIFKKVGDHTLHEFEVALQNYSRTGKPHILTTIKRVHPDEQPADEVYALMEKLDKELHHFYNFYSTPDQLQLWLFMQILILKLDMTELAAQGNFITANGRKIADLRNIPLFSLDDTLKKLEEELALVRSLYFSLQRDLQANPKDDVLYQKFTEAADRKSSLESRIQKRREFLLNLLKRITQEASSADSSPKLQEALRLLEMGNAEAALKVLSLDEILADIELNKALAQNGNAGLALNARELFARITALEKKGVDLKTAEEIDEIYEELVQLCAYPGVDKKYLQHYSVFLLGQNQLDKAVQMAERLQYFYDDPEASVTRQNRAELKNKLGILYTTANRLQEAEAAFLASIEIGTELEAEEPGRYTHSLADVNNNLSILYLRTDRTELAEQSLLKAMVFYQKKALEQPDANNKELVHGYNNLGNVYSQTNRMSQAEEAYLKALKIQQKPDVLNSEEDISRLARLYYNLGNLYRRHSRIKDSEEAYLKALDIQESLWKKNPNAAAVDLANSWNNLAILYRTANDTAREINAYQKALEVRRHLAFKNPERFNPDLARTWARLGQIYEKEGRLKEAEQAYQQALDIRRDLVLKDPDRFNPDFGYSLAILGLLFEKEGRLKEAEQVQQQSLEIRKQLAEKKPEDFLPDLAHSWNNLAILYRKTERYQQAEQALNKALEIRKKLAEKKPETYEPILANTITQMGYLYHNQKKEADGLLYFTGALQIRKRLAETNSQQARADLAEAYFSLGLAFGRCEDTASKMKLLKEAQDIWLELSKENPDLYGPNLQQVQNIMAQTKAAAASGNYMS